MRQDSSGVSLLFEEFGEDDSAFSKQHRNCGTFKAFFMSFLNFFRNIFYKNTELTNRKLYCNRKSVKEFVGNYISTTKYNAFTFLPKFLYEQFTKASNVVFLIISAIQMIPNISPSGKYTTLFPLMLMTCFSAAKEIMEDFKRLVSDRSTNNSTTIVLRDTWIKVKWHEIKVGDIVRVLCNEVVPADMCIISTSDPDALCYVETCSLDGETNMKIKQALKQTSHLVSEEVLRVLDASIECEPPNNRIYEFNGMLEIGIDRGERIPYNITNDQIILRGSHVRNTMYAIGIVVYTGHESKIMLNSLPSPIKRSSVEKILNRMILFLVALLLCISSIASIVYILYTVPDCLKSNPYYKLISPKFMDFVFIFFTIFILLHNIIPISLNVTIEMIKLIHCYFISKDISLYDEEIDYPAQAKTSAVVEELGQINYIFSDKTGTLTKNLMKLMQVSINGIIYGEQEEFGASVSNALLTDQRDEIDLFLTALSICNTVRSQNEDGSIVFHSSSPDEVALAQGIYKCGYLIGTRTTKELKMIASGKEFIYEILHILEFTSDRKRMSVIARRDNRIFIFCKGADSVILDRIHSDQSTDEILDHLNRFAKSGFRTLLVSYAELAEELYQRWLEDFNAASMSLLDRNTEMIKVYEDIERNLSILGATAIEDCLQDQVYDCITKLIQANIRFVMLTGDRIETAINIGFSTGMLSESLDIEVISNSDREVFESKMDEIIDKYKIPMTYIERSKMFTQPPQTMDIALVIDGKSLEHAFEGNLMKKFLRVILSCKSVICSRVSPSQKSQVVKTVSDNVVGSVTLAIGDGANDCPMIQAAHVGVGIAGKEGMQAANSSDFAISQFRFLSTLLLVHGQTSYRRVTSAILFCFYKGSLLNSILFFYLFYNRGSGAFIFNKIAYMLYNVIFTAYQPFVFGLFQLISQRDALINFPACFQSIRNNKIFNLTKFMGWFSNGIFHGAIIFFFTYYIHIHQIASHVAFPITINYIGQIIYTCVMIVVTGKACLELHIWTMPAVWIFLFGIFSWIIFCTVSSRHLWAHIFKDPLLLNIDAWIMGNVSFWLWLLMIPFLTLIVDIIVYTAKNTWFPAYYVIMNEALNRGQVDMESGTSVQNARKQVEIHKEQVRNRYKKYFGFAYSFAEESNMRMTSFFSSGS